MESEQNAPDNHDLSEVFSSLDSMQFEEKVHVLKLEIVKMMEEFPTSDYVNVAIAAKGSSIRVLGLNFFNKDGSESTRITDNKPDMV